MSPNPSQPKKTWNTPTLIVYGTVETITQKTVLKTYGPGDDFFKEIMTVGGSPTS